jgi:hypothetical protein
MSLFDSTNFERHGNTENDIHLDNIEDIQETVTQLTSAALKNIKIFTQDLEHNIYNDELIKQNLLKFTRDSRHAKIQILVSDLTESLHYGHRLIQLSQQLTSAMEIRNTPEDYQGTGIAFILIDQSSFVFKPDNSKQEAIYSSCKYRSNKLVDFFTPAWEQAQQNQHTRRLSI